MDDLISRPAAFNTVTEYRDQLCEIFGDENEMIRVVDIVKHRLIALPSVQSDRKKGKWLPDNNCYHTPHFICSACGVSQEVDTVMYKPSWAFCPLCGADMRGDSDD